VRTAHLSVLNKHENVTLSSDKNYSKHIKNEIKCKDSTAIGN